MSDDQPAPVEPDAARRDRILYAAGYATAIGALLLGASYLLSRVKPCPPGWQVRIDPDLPELVLITDPSGVTCRARLLTDDPHFAAPPVDPQGLVKPETEHDPQHFGVVDVGDFGEPPRGVPVPVPPDQDVFGLV
jgi:hypothetical protein